MLQQRLLITPDRLGDIPILVGEAQKGCKIICFDGLGDEHGESAGEFISELGGANLITELRFENCKLAAGSLGAVCSQGLAHLPKLSMW